MGYEMTVTHELVHAGQPRAYADSVYESYLTFSTPEGQLWASQFCHKAAAAELVKPYVRLMVAGFVEDTPEHKREWHQPWLEKLEMVAPGRWHVIVMSPYLD